MAIVARKGLWLSRTGQMFPDPLSPLSPWAGSSNGQPAHSLSPDYGGLVQAMASGEMRLASASNLQLYSSTLNVVVGAGGQSDVISVTSNLVVINADVQIRGSVETYNSTEVNLQDKVVRLAYPDEATIASGMAPSEASLHGAGMQLADDVSGGRAYEKSIRWRAGGEVGRGPSGLVARGAESNCPYWEVRGGGLRLTSPARGVLRGGVPREGGPAAPSGEVSYGFCIDDREELVVYKRWTNAQGAASYQRVFTFGSTSVPYAPPSSTNVFKQ